MEAYPIDEFRRETEQIELREPDDLLGLIPLAARLAVLTGKGNKGDDSQLRRCWQFATECRADLAKLLAERTQQGVWDLGYAIGEDLALAVIDAQDFYCFYELEKDLLPPDAQLSLEAWFQEAEETPLDEEAVESLHVFLERFPIPEKYRLATVHAPVSTFMQAVLASQAKPPAPTRESWPAVPTGVPAYEELLLTDHGGVPDVLKGMVQRLDAEFKVLGVGPVFVSRRLSDNWEIVLDACGPNDQELPIRSVRLGLLPGRLAEPEHTDRWLVNLGWVAPSQRLTVLKKPITIAFQNGRRLEIHDA